MLYCAVCVCACNLVGTHGHGDILLGDLIVSNVPHVISCQLQDVRRDVLQHGDHVHGHLVVDLIAQHLLKHSSGEHTRGIMGNVRKPHDEETYLEQGMDLINRQRQRVPPPPLLNGALSIAERPLIDRVRKTLLHALLERKGAGSGQEA